MAKRFIDTGLFDDEWFSELKLQSKIFWIYFITKCDHAGFLKYNERLIKFQTGIQDLPETLKEFSPNRVVRVSEQLLFSPKFVHYQYPHFPNCNFAAAKSAMQIMTKNGIDINSYLTVPELLPNSYGNGNSNGDSNGIGKEERILKNIEGFEYVWDKWLNYKKTEHREYYKTLNTEQAAFDKLYEFSMGDVKIAEEIINQSITNRWKGIFEIKIHANNSKGVKKSDTDVISDRINGLINAQSARKYAD
jgi:hypothetical protein